MGWMTALKLVPWGEVIAATPQLVQGARKLLGKTRPGAGKPPGTEDALAGEARTPPGPVEERLQQLAQRVAQLEQEQQEGAVLIGSLAEHNAQVVRAVEALRVRTQRLTRWLIALGALCAALLVWALRQ